jgi:hypothetical protein
MLYNIEKKRKFAVKNMKIIAPETSAAEVIT